MKRGWIILLLSIVLTHCYAGEYNNGYKPMLSEGKVWNYILHTPYGNEKMSIEVKGDTTINKQECKKLYLKTSQGSWLYGCCYEIWPFSTVWVYPQIRIEEGSDGRPVISKQKVEEAVQRFAFWNNNKSPADIGESASQYRDVLGTILYMQGYYPYYVVYNYDLVEIRGNTLARVTVTGLPASEEQTGGTVSEIWFSGVGDSRWGIMHPNDGLREVRKDWLELESCIEGDQCLYTNADINAEALQPEYHPFVEDNKVWAYDKNPDGAKDYCFYMRGDTIIGGRKCLKMYSENEYNDGKVNYKGAYYEENRQVFRYWPGEENALIQYDFSLGLGETVLQEPLRTITDSIGVQCFANIVAMDGGVPYRMLAIYEVVKWANREKEEVTDYSHTGAWIEGVGPAFMLDVGYFYGFGLIGGRWGNGIQYCSVNGKVFYRSPWYKGQTDIHQPVFETSERARDTDYIYDLSGRHLESAPASGLYIRNGKKYVVK